MLKHARFAIVSSLLALVVAGYAAPASAAPSAWSFVDVGLHVEQGQPLILVSGDLPDDAPLPYEAELAVPSGTQLQWIGEILGGSGCLSEVVISSLGVTQDLTAGAATVALPALEPGTYAFACAMGHQTGSLVVQ